MTKRMRYLRNVAVWLLLLLVSVVLTNVIDSFINANRPGGESVTWHWWLSNLWTSAAIAVPFAVLVLFWWLTFLLPMQQRAKQDLTTEIESIKENLRQEIAARLSPTPGSNLIGVMSILTPLFDQNVKEPKSILSFLLHVRRSKTQFVEVEQSIERVSHDFHVLRRKIVNESNWKQTMEEFEDSVLKSFLQICSDLRAQKQAWQSTWMWGKNEDGMSQVYEGFCLAWDAFSRDASYGTMSVPRSLKGLLGVED